ncbi:hypothetical protein R1flu_018531 [Riccia fluitans]|uniref:Thioredoxin domain-containing protein n=1 Tax=Riccia fluitans TaxID=41844 RepID=A0ABD1ZGA1_9MARC
MEGLAALRQVVTPTTSFVRSFQPQESRVRVGNVLRFAPTFRRNSSLGHVQLDRRSVALKATRTFTSFDDMIASSDLPILVEFYAAWCGPCQVMEPILREIAPAISGRIRFVKIDTEKYPAVASPYGIGALPTFILSVDGKPVDRLVKLSLSAI